MLLLLRKKRGEKRGMRRTYFRSRNFVTSGQKAPTREDIAQLPVAHAQNILPEVSIGKFANHQFDKTKFLQDMKSIPSGTPVSWTELARTYQVRNAQGNAPGNAEQVLFQFARQNGIDFFSATETRE
jgi:hypothetical protein